MYACYINTLGRGERGEREREKRREDSVDKKKWVRGWEGSSRCGKEILYEPLSQTLSHYSSPRFYPTVVIVALAVRLSSHGSSYLRLV